MGPRKTAIFTLLFLIPTSLILAQSRLTVENIFGSSRFSPRGLLAPEWTPDNKAISALRGGNGPRNLILERIDLKTGQRSLLIDSKTTSALQPVRREKRFNLPSYIWSPSGKHILLPTEEDLFLYDIRAGEVRQITGDTAEERDPTFSPDSKKIAYLKNHDLVVLDLASLTEIRLTDRGTENLLIGRFDWVYEEEFGIRTGFTWSPDSRFLAFFELDQSGENRFPIVDFIPVHNVAPEMAYPKAGDPNGIVRIGIVPAEGGPVVWMDIGRETDQYIPRIHWLKDSRTLAIQRLNRDQNRLDLLFAETNDGSSRVVLTEHDPSGWVDPADNITFLDDGNHFLWTSERSGWNHVFLYDLEGHVVSTITHGSWDVVNLEGVNEKTETVYFTATEKSAIERHLYSVQFDGSGFRRLTEDPGTHFVNFSPDTRYFIDVYSTATTPPRTTLHRETGRMVHILDAGTIEDVAAMNLSAPEFFTITTADGLELNAMLIKPPDFDPLKRYPVLVYTYGGPGSQTVQNGWLGTRGLWHQMMAQHGFLIFSVDNRGTGWKGNDFKNLLYRNLGKGVLDQIEGSKYLSSLPYVDPDRIGIWGWSGGGWMTCMAMTRGAGYFKAGVAVAPVTDFRNYDTIWTERYMDQPQNNPSGYDASNPLTYIDRYRSGLFIIHGSADDNVHLSNSMQMAFALQNAGKPFEMMIYPRKLHGIRGRDTQVHLFNAITAYFLKEL